MSNIIKSIEKKILSGSYITAESHRFGQHRMRDYTERGGDSYFQ